MHDRVGTIAACKLSSTLLLTTAVTAAAVLAVHGVVTVWGEVIVVVV